MNYRLFTTSLLALILTTPLKALAGEEAGSKLTKARNLGIPVIDENKLLEMVGK